MGGGLMQLVAYGAQDIYLTGNPQITFFKVVYRRHTNFSMETIQQTINGTSTLVAASTSTGSVTVSRNGDLVGKVYVRCDQSTGSGVFGDKLISEVELEIGGQRIDKHTEEWNQIVAELTTPKSKQASKYKSNLNKINKELTKHCIALNLDDKALTIIEKELIHNIQKDKEYKFWKEYIHYSLNFSLVTLRRIFSNNSLKLVLNFYEADMKIKIC